MVGALKEAVREDLAHVGDLGEADLDFVFENFCRVKEPEVKSRIGKMEYLVPGRRSWEMESIKPGNIILNWRQLLGSIPAVGLTIAGVGTSWILVVLAALDVWQKLYSSAKVKLEKEQAVAIRQMWDHHDGTQHISEEKALQVTNEALASFGFAELDREKFAGVIDDLVRIGCVEITEGRIWLREWIRRPWRSD